MVTNDDTGGQIVFRINGTSMALDGAITELDIDTDTNPATGDTEYLGADYAFQLDPSQCLFGFWHWDGADWVDTPSATVSVSGGDSGMVVSVNRSELGGTAEFNFQTETFGALGGILGGDHAPDNGMWPNERPLARAGFWGTKRWASAMNICSRVASGTAFPGDEGFNWPPRANPAPCNAARRRPLGAAWNRLD